eukprot:scaffold44817_cov59-Phaeocystis_antarctica.AAC.3
MPDKATPRPRTRDLREGKPSSWCQASPWTTPSVATTTLTSTTVSGRNYLLITPQDAPRASAHTQHHDVAHPAPDETPAAHLAAASITLPVHAWRHRCGDGRAWRGDAAHSQAATATRCSRRRDEAVRGRYVQRHGGHVAPDRRTAGRALVRSA